MWWFVRMAQDTTALYGTLHGYTEGNCINTYSPSFEQRGGARINRRTGRDDVIDQDTPAASQTRRRLDVKGAGNIDETFLFVQRGLRRRVLAPSRGLRFDAAHHPAAISSA